MSYLDKIDKTRLPKHVAIIMDGNGRWAKSQGKDRSYGHMEGVVSVRHVTEAARELGVSYLTIYAFSTENWNRPESEVFDLMDLMMKALERETPDLIKVGVRLEIIGDMNRLPEKVRNRAIKCMSETADGHEMTLILALSYSSRWEIVEAVKSIARDVKENKLTVQDIDEALVSNRLTTKNYPEPDLLIRTGGELRISNFLMWQLSYSELYFTETPWPAFRKEEFYEAIYSFQSRERRYGKTSEQVQN
ncbi:MAG: isoprenyl transferase [Bacteroidales bacterium]|nr:isoprenyl transferase [Bacteroidales bacterium]MDD3908254.1 isoprenyl transferase [Bacteroidales bacterium]MDD4713483.1 isoprenyl transferase [Bacteroidales bacterium]MEA4840809.1 isoprenyl transferase [Bacteroidales bacterium]